MPSSTTRPPEAASEGRQVSVSLFDATLEQTLVSLVRRAKEDGEDLDAEALLSTIRHRLFGNEAGERLCIGRFEILRRLGHGGMGVVYEAYDPALRRRVAIKILTSALASAAAGDLLTQEAQTIAQLSHPNIVTVHEVGRVGDEVFIAMELLDGQTLRQWQAVPQPWRTVLATYRAAGEGLAAAHQAGIVHGDFKPQNVLVAAPSRVRVVDFGLARAAEVLHAVDRKALDHLPLAIERAQERRGGTPEYMAPELAGGGDPTASSDQFAFCRSLSQALRLQDELHRHRAWTRRGGRAPAWVRVAVGRGMHPDPAHRWPSMRALLDALSTDRRDRRWRWIAIASVAATTLVTLGVPWLVEAQRVRACATMGSSFEPLWNASRKGQLEAAATHSSDSSVRASWTLASTALDRFADEWIALRRETCLATAYAGGIVSPEVGDRQACLDRRKADFETLLSVLSERPGEINFHTMSVAATLLPPSTCQDAELGRRENLTPRTPDGRPEVTALREQTARAQTLLRLGRLDEASEIADQVTQRAAHLDFAPLTAEAELLRAQILLDNGGDAKSAAEAAERSAMAALTARHESAFANAASMNMFLGARLGHQAEADLWRQIGAAQLKRMSGDGIEDAYFHNNLGSLLRTRGDCPGGRAEFAHAIRIKSRLWGPDSLEVAKSRSNLGVIELECGDFEAAEQTDRLAVAAMMRHVGPIHPFVAVGYGNLAEVTERRGDTDGAYANFNLALKALIASHGPNHAWSGVFYAGRCRAEVARGELEAAATSCREAKEQTQRGFGELSPYYAEALVAEGELEFRRGSALAASLAAEHGAKIIEQSGDHGPNLAHAQFLWARALDALGTQPERVIELAQAAERIYRARGGDWTRLADDIAAWSGPRTYSLSGTKHTPTSANAGFNSAAAPGNATQRVGAGHSLPAPSRSQ